MWVLLFDIIPYCLLCGCLLRLTTVSYIGPNSEIKLNILTAESTDNCLLVDLRRLRRQLCECLIEKLCL